MDSLAAYLSASGIDKTAGKLQPYLDGAVIVDARLLKLDDAAAWVQEISKCGCLSRSS